MKLSVLLASHRHLSMRTSRQLTKWLRISSWSGWIVCWLLTPPGLVGQGSEFAGGAELFLRAWQTEDGLPENMVVNAAQTPDGFLWVATRRGLFRFDGVRFQQYLPVNEAGISTSLIRVMTRDQSGRLWLAKDRGALVCIDRGQVTHVLTPTNGLSVFQTRSMLADRAGNIWLSDSSGKIYYVKEGFVQRFGEESGLSGQPTWLACDEKGQLWVSHGKQIGIFDNGRLDTVYTAKNPVSRIHAARNDGVWFCDGAQVFLACAGKTPETR